MKLKDFSHQRISVSKEGEIWQYKLPSGQNLIQKKLSERGKRYISIINEYIKRTGKKRLEHWYSVRLIDNKILEYECEELKDFCETEKTMAQVVEVLKELFVKTGLYYVDFGFERNNIMQNEDGLLKVVDYGSGFLSVDKQFMQFMDRYYTFYFQPDLYRKQLLCWYLFHVKQYRFFNKGFVSRWNNKLLTPLVNCLLVLFLAIQLKRRDFRFARLVMRQRKFDQQFFNELIAFFNR